MRTFVILASTVALAGSAVALPTIASASSCSNTGTAVGAVAGGLLGNGVSRGGGKTGGTIIGALGGAVVGHEIAKRNCGNTAARHSCRYHTYYNSRGNPYRVHECMGRDGRWYRS